MPEPESVRVGSQGFFDDVKALLGDRLAYRMLDPDGGPRITVIDLVDRDTEAVAAIAARRGIEEWVRIERADPAHLEAWERLRHDLLRLQDADPRVLQSYPMPDKGYRRPPVALGLADTAESTAAELYTRYGDFVELTVGALPYPLWPHEQERRRRQRRDPDRPTTATPVDPGELTVALDGPLTVRAGDTVRHTVLVTNHSEETVAVQTNGQLTATIVEEHTGRRVGGFAGAQRLPLRSFRVVPSRTRPIPLLVGTTSFRPELGYTVPPGAWALTVTLSLADRRKLVSGPMPFTII